MVLEEIGIAGIPICYENSDGQLVAIDGHCRMHDVGAKQEWQVAVLDITEEEARKLIALYDPISEMAEADPHILQDLLSTLQFENDALTDLLQDIAIDNGVQLIMPVSGSGIEEEEELFSLDYTLVDGVEGTEYTGNIADNITKCTCPCCGHTHVKKN